MSLEIAEMEQLITPIDKMVVRYLQRNKNGVTMMDIVHRIQSEVGDDHGDLGQAVSGVLANAIELGFVEKSEPSKHSCSCKVGRRRRRGGRSRVRRRRSRSRVRRRRRGIRRRRLRPRGI